MKTTQPKIKKGTTFNGWATFNWGYSYNRVFRTRKDAMKNILKNEPENTTWNDIKDHYRIIKVKCVTIK